LQVLQEWLEQDEQPDPDDLSRLPPPPMPKAEKSLRTGPPQALQRTSASRPSETRRSNFIRQESQQNS